MSVACAVQEVHVCPVSVLQRNVAASPSSISITVYLLNTRQNSKIRTDRKIAVIEMCMDSSEINLCYRNHSQK
jgi:hypothetical protein